MSEDDLYYFESDHLALRGNKDYSEVLKTLFILCAQRERAVKDYSKAVELKKEALDDPGKVLEKIINGESLGMPDLHNVPELPRVDWSKYEAKIADEALKSIYTDKETPKKTPEVKKQSKASHGRWTLEEQKRLEELLQVYPPEPVEMRRFKKIADALGNRTIQQVSSRVQKYFLKLYKAGLPIPGRIPKSAERHKRSALHKHQRHNHYLWKPTTFFPELCVPVVMDEDNVPGPSADASPKPSTSSNYLLPNNYHDNYEFLHKSEAELQLELLKRVRKEKLREDGAEPFTQIGFKCDNCHEEPLIGTRWHCATCVNDSVDFCTDCVLAQMHSDNPHPLNHHLVSYSGREGDFSDSESNESLPETANDNQELSESSGCEFDEEMSDKDGEQDDFDLADETDHSEN